MRNLHSSILLFSFFFILITVASSCSENEDDVSAPEITITKPAENDTIHVAKSKVYIEVKSNNSANIDHLEMTVSTQSGTPLYMYEEDHIKNHSFSCSEDFSCNDIAVVTKVKLIVTCENEFHSWRKKEVNFYLTP